MSAATSFSSADDVRDVTDANRPPIPSLDELLDVGEGGLRALYAAGSVPRLEDIKGDLRGRMLGLQIGGGAVAKVGRLLAGRSWFPWRGKSFSLLSSSPARGDGINRVFVDRNKWFRFETFVGKSRAGDFDAVQLDYDNKDNPFFIRAIKDEIREVRPGLYLGQAYIVTGTTECLALYFALELPRLHGISA